MVSKLSRRAFMKSAAFGVPALMTGSIMARSYSANEKLDVAMIGIGGQGFDNFKEMYRENIVAVCDVDFERAGKPYQRFEKSKQFTDFRRMFDALHASMDAVVISTPDHTHFHPAYTALDLGKHVYLEKPLAHSVWETRTLTDLAQRKGLVTQLGAQRHANSNMRRVVECIQSGAIGDVSVVHSWINSDRGLYPRLTEPQVVPNTLDYELWLGPVEHRPYDSKITPYGWRFWWDFGTGETGNWGCHILDIPYWALNLDHCIRVRAKEQTPHPEMTPQTFHATLDYPAKGSRGAVTLHWHQQKGGPDILRELGLSAEKSNTLFIGSKGMLLCGFDQHKLFPEEKFAEYAAPEPFIPESPGFRKEFINACKGDVVPPTCHFGYTGPMTEAVLLANNAFRSQSEFDWDHQALTCTGAPEAQALLKPVFKPGWEVNA